MAARAMDNFGLSKLSIVNPRDGWPSKKAESSAKHADKIINYYRLKSNALFIRKGHRSNYNSPQRFN